MAERRDWFAMPIEGLGLSLRGLRSARRAGAGTVGELCQLTEDQVLHAGAGGFGTTALGDVRGRLRAFGLRLNDDKAGPCIIREK
jgi:DNA-directed RNA polymerase alpha subunit